MIHVKLKICLSHSVVEKEKKKTPVSGGVLVSCSWALVVPLKREAGHPSQKPRRRAVGEQQDPSPGLRHRGGRTFQRARGRRPGRKRSGSATRAPTASPSARARALPLTPRVRGGQSHFSRSPRGAPCFILYSEDAD